MARRRLTSDMKHGAVQTEEELNPSGGHKNTCTRFLLAL